MKPDKSCCGGMELIRTTTGLIVFHQQKGWCFKHDDMFFSFDYCPFCGKKVNK